MINKNNTPQYRDYTSKLASKPKTVIVVYDQPKVVIVRRYTKTIVSRVNPDEYRKQFDRVLLDTATLLEWTRRLNIQEHMITPPMIY